MSKLKHVEGIGLIDLSAITFIGEATPMCGYFCVSVDGWQQTFHSSARDNLIKAIEEHDKFFYGSIE